jgi:hypothetical protein
VKVEVTVEEEARKPPKRLSVEVALAPRAVTLARVSLSTKRYAGQLVPFVRQTVRPFTKSCEVETTPEAKRFVVVTLVAVTFDPTAFRKLIDPPLMRDVFRVVMVPVVD